MCYKRRGNKFSSVRVGALVLIFQKASLFKVVMYSFSNIKIYYFCGRNDEAEDSFEGFNDQEETLEEKFEYSIFNPPLYRQRYNIVLETLQDERWVETMTRGKSEY